MTAEGLISIQAMTARIACRWMTARHLEAVSESIDQAARLPAGPGPQDRPDLMRAS